ncbi:MAG: type II secretion system major pseudopilin GspG [Puniceicoccales bacterium]|jgi:general secretion pathway protein G|nr:type II secretion system major pseudopilin GspG [Puniceicoccales bacterium]
MRLMSRSKGFSLVEILIVLAIIAGITGLLVSNLDGIFGSSKEQIAHIFVNEALKAPLMAYKMNIGNYPSTAEGLQALVEAPSGKEHKWRGPYVESMPKDPWGNDYLYAYPGVHNRAMYDVWSMGSPSKGKEIGNW